MRYRKLSSTGDFVFGHGSADYYINNVQAVAQAIETALKLVQGEWFLDNTAGVPYFTNVFGYGTQTLYDLTFQSAILGVPNVLSIVSYSSSLDPRTRFLTVTVTVNTSFGTTTVSKNIPTVAPSGYGVTPWGVGGFGV